MIEAMAAPPNNPESAVKIYGRAASSRGYMIRDFLNRSDVPYVWTELVSDEDARRLAAVSVDSATS